jgi:hypothetical protein
VGGGAEVCGTSGTVEKKFGKIEDNFDYTFVN